MGGFSSADFPGRSGQSSLMHALIVLSVAVIFVFTFNQPVLSIAFTGCLKVHAVILLIQFSAVTIIPKTCKKKKKTKTFLAPQY